VPGPSHWWNSLDPPAGAAVSLIRNGWIRLALAPRSGHEVGAGRLGILEGPAGPAEARPPAAVALRRGEDAEPRQLGLQGAWIIQEESAGCAISR
jgi:hypothetical protein